MLEGNNDIKKYSAEDIDRYLNRQMSEGEMHALEKAALEDPFLAEAIEGYMNTPPVSVKKDIDKLVGELNEKTNTRRVVAIGYKRFAWSAAAAVIIVLGAATTWYWLRPSADNNIAQKIQEEQTVPATAPPAIQQDQLKIIDTSHLLNVPVKEPVTIASPAEKKTIPSPLPGIVAANESEERTREQKKDIAAARMKADDHAQPVAATKNQEEHQAEVADVSVGRRDTINRLTADMATAPARDESQLASTGYFTPYIFSGRITDDKNKPLPFVNISIPNTPTSIYSDAEGNFRLASADSQLVVQLKSVGFEEVKATLHSNIAANTLQLKPHKNSLQEVVVTGYGASRKQAMGVAKTDKKEDAVADEESEAEPRDGWAAYDAYMMNNARLPGISNSPGLKGSVELSFKVNKYGIISELEVKHSTCTPCDKEAVRLIKEGPAWRLVSGEKPAKVALTMHF